MQLIEKTFLGVRIAEIRLKAEGRPDITLFPMLHVADERFFVSVAVAADAHEIVLVEAAKGMAGRKLTGYRAIAQRKEIGVVLQSRGMNGKRYPHWRVSDLPEARLDELYRRIPFWRLAFFRIASAVYYRLMSKREHFIASIANLEDHEATTKNIEGMREHLGDAFVTLIFDERDAALARHIDAAIGEGPRNIAIVWGASHAPRVLRHIRERYRYMVESAEWRVAVAAL